MKIRFSILFLFLLFISYGDILAQEIGEPTVIDLKLLGGKQIQDLERIQEENPQDLRGYLDERRQSLQQELEDLRNNNPEEFQAAILELKESLTNRIKEMTNDDPQRLESLMEKRREEERIMLERIKEEDPDRFTEIINIREENLIRKLDFIKASDEKQRIRPEIDIEQQTSISSEGVGSNQNLMPLNNRPAKGKITGTPIRAQSLAEPETTPEITDELETVLPGKPVPSKRPRIINSQASETPEEKPSVNERPQILPETIEPELPEGPSPILPPEIDELPQYNGSKRPMKGKIEPPDEIEPPPIEIPDMIDRPSKRPRPRR